MIPPDCDRWTQPRADGTPMQRIGGASSSAARTRIVRTRAREGPATGVQAAEVLIVGGGPAGLSTWLHLQALAPALAAHTVLIEKAAYPRPKLCGGGITPLGTKLLSGLRIDLDIPSVPVHKIEFRFGHHAQLFERREALRVARRLELDHALAAAAVARGMRLAQGCAFHRFARDGDRLHVTTDDGEYRVRILVGADGVNSRVRQCMGLTDDSRIARLIEVVSVDPRVADICPRDTAIFDFTPLQHGLQGYVWHFPWIVDGAAALNSGIYDSRVHPERPRADLKSIFSRHLHAGVELADEPWSGHPLRWYAAESVVAQPNVFLIGDAAGVDAVLGEGIAPALDYGDFAARLIIDAVRRRDISFATSRTLFARHPVGASLALRGTIARTLYESADGAAERVGSFIASWLAGRARA